MPVSNAHFDAQIDRLLGYFFAGQPTDRFDPVREEYARAFQGRERWDDQLFAAAVTQAIDHCPKLPRIEEFRAIGELVRDQLAREAAWAAQQQGLHRPALAAPPVREQPAARPRAVHRAEWDRQVAIGKARIRRRHALIDAYRAATGQSSRVGVPSEVWRGKDEATETEVAAVLAELARGGGWTGPLAAPLQRVGADLLHAAARAAVPLPAGRAEPDDPADAAETIETVPF